MGWKSVTDQIKNGERSGNHDLAPLTNLDAVFGRGRKVDGIRKGSLYRNLIEIHVTPYNNISVSNAGVRIDYIQDKIMAVVQDMGGRFVMRQVGGTSGVGKNGAANNCGLIELFPELKDDRSLILKKIRRALFNENKRRLDLSEAKREVVEEEMEDRLEELNAQLIEKRKGGQHLARAQAQAEALALQEASEAEEVATPRKPKKQKTASTMTMTTRKVKKVVVRENSSSSRDTQSNADTDTTASESLNSSNSSSHNSQQLMDDYLIDDNIDADGGFLSEIDDLILHNEGQGAAADPLVSWDFQFGEPDASFEGVLQEETA